MFSHIYSYFFCRCYRSKGNSSVCHRVTPSPQTLNRKPHPEEAVTDLPLFLSPALFLSISISLVLSSHPFLLSLFLTLSYIISSMLYTHNFPYIPVLFCSFSFMVVRQKNWALQKRDCIQLRSSLNFLCKWKKDTGLKSVVFKDVGRLWDLLCLRIRVLSWD